MPARGAGAGSGMRERSLPHLVLSRTQITPRGFARSLSGQASPASTRSGARKRTTTRSSTTSSSATASTRVRAGSSIARYYKRHPPARRRVGPPRSIASPRPLRIGLGTGPAKRADPAIKLQRWGADAGRPVARLGEYIDIVRSRSAAKRSTRGRVLRGGACPAPAPSRNARSDLPRGRWGSAHPARGPQGPTGLLLLPERGTHARTARARREEARGVGSRPGRRSPCCSRSASTRTGGGRNALPAPSLLPVPRSAVLPASCSATTVSRGGRGDQVRPGGGWNRRRWPHVPDEALDQVAIAGEPGECATRLDEFHGRGIRLAVLYPFPGRGRLGGRLPQHGRDVFAVTAAAA